MTLLLLRIAVFLATISLVRSTQNTTITWSLSHPDSFNVSSHYPDSRRNPAYWSDADGNAYLFGGSSSRKLWFFNSTSGAWKILHTMLKPRPDSRNAAVMCGTGRGSDAKIVLLGGETTKGRLAAKIWIFFAKNLTWRCVGGANFSGAAAQAWCDASRGVAYIFGGRDATRSHGLFDEFWMFSFENSTLKRVGGRRPPSRYGAMTWTTSTGLWMFGGGRGSSTTNLWKYDLGRREWGVVYEGGDEVVGVYGDEFVGSGENHPGYRQGGFGFVGACGNLWLFGGSGYGDRKEEWMGILNDLWMFDVGRRVWVWMGGLRKVEGSGRLGSSPWCSPRAEGAVWRAGNAAWVFGGFGHDIDGNDAGAMNDLWKLEISRECEAAMLAENETVGSASPELNPTLATTTEASSENVSLRATPSTAAELWNATSGVSMTQTTVPTPSTAAELRNATLGVNETRSSIQTPVPTPSTAAVIAENVSLGATPSTAAELRNATLGVNKTPSSMQTTVPTSAAVTAADLLIRTEELNASLVVNTTQSTVQSTVPTKTEIFNATLNVSVDTAGIETTIQSVIETSTTTGRPTESEQTELASESMHTKAPTLPAEPNASDVLTMGSSVTEVVTPSTEEAILTTQTREKTTEPSATEKSRLLSSPTSASTQPPPTSASIISYSTTENASIKPSSPSRTSPTTNQVGSTSPPDVLTEEQSTELTSAESTPTQRLVPPETQLAPSARHEYPTQRINSAWFGSSNSVAYITICVASFSVLLLVLAIFCGRKRKRKSGSTAAALTATAVGRFRYQKVASEDATEW